MNEKLLMSVLLVTVLFIIWLALKINIKVKKQKITEIKSLDLRNYVTFVNNFNVAEEEEKKGNMKIARIHFEQALECLEKEPEPDQMVLETITEVKERISRLKNS